MNYIDQSIPLPEVRNFKLSDFWIGKKMGKGQFGEVFLCRNKQTGEPFAIKALQKEVASNSNKRSFKRTPSSQHYLQMK